MSERSRWRPAAFTVAAATAVLAAAAAADDGDPLGVAPGRPRVDVSLVAEHGSVRPGTTTWVALRFEIEDGWHVYWRNPGDAGAPPAAAWTLPAGYRAGALVFPVPVRHVEDPLVTFVHEGTVVLPVAIDVPADAEPGKSAQFRADVSWLACSDVCVAGKTSVALTLPVADREPTATDADAKTFAAARSALPKPVDAAKARAVHDGARVMLDLSAAGVAPRAPDRVEFFPADESLVTYAPARLAGDGPRIELTPRGAKLAKDARLRGVLVVEGRDGRTGHEIDLPVAAPASPGTEERR